MAASEAIALGAPLSTSSLMPSKHTEGMANHFDDGLSTSTHQSDKDNGTHTREAQHKSINGGMAVQSPQQEHLDPLDHLNPDSHFHDLPTSTTPRPRSNHPKSLASYVSAHPTRPVRSAISHLYPKPNPLVRLLRRFKVRHDVICGLTDQEMELWEKREGKERRIEAGWRLEGEDEDGKNGEERVVVSPLFWKMYVSLLPTLQRDPLSGLVPPALLGSTTTMPLSIISLIPDIMKHYRDCIVRAKKEVFLITNYWQPSNSVNTISGALRELSNLHVKRQKVAGGSLANIVVKMIYDRGSWEQLVNAHANVPPKGWEVLNIPMPHEIPGIDLQVMNYHKVLLGTLHVKFCIIDRKVALVNSNNIQDRPNLELMTHLEGPIVDSFYEAALLSWSNKLEPMLPCISTAYPRPVNNRYRFGVHNQYLEELEVLKAAKAARILLRSQAKAAREEDAAGEGGDERFRHVVRRVMQRGMSQVEDWAEAFTFDHPDGIDGERHHVSWGERVRMGLGSRPPSRKNSTDAVHPLQHFRPDEGKPVLEKIESPTTGQGSPTLNGDANGDAHEMSKLQESPRKDMVQLPEHQQQDPSPKKITIAVPPPVRPVIGEADASGSAPESSVGIGGADGNGNKANGDHADNATRKRARSGSQRMQALSEKFNAGALSEAWATVEDSEDLDTFAPHVLHTPHKPFPIAMTNRKPHGMPGHHDIRNPQNAAWLAGFRYSQKRVFIQTPTLNARPIRRAIKQTCRRGVEVILFLDLGFNDKGESIPFQGGTNEQVVERLYNILRPEGKAKHLKVYWYTGKDQIRPLNAVKKQRNAHIKFANFDDQVAILGNGNQDTQSWFHSSEANIMIDNPTIIAELMETLYTNQNTHIYGLVGEDGIWRDAEGKDLSTYDATKKGKHQGLAGLIQFAKTI